MSTKNASEISLYKPVLNATTSFSAADFMVGKFSNKARRA
jgi:hypothetical protein